MSFVDVVIDNKSDFTDAFYTYKYDGSVHKGDIVNVSFGRGKKLKTAFVVDVMEKLEKDIPSIKQIDSVRKDYRLSKEAIDTAVWMKKRYFTRYLDCISLFLPKLIKEKKIDGDVNAKININSDININLNAIKQINDEFLKQKSLTQEQENAFENIKSSFDNEKEIFLLDAKVSRDKLELYIHLVKENICRGKQSIILVPEMTMIDQLEREFKQIFIEQVAILHSGMGVRARRKVWEEIDSGEKNIIIGTRIAAFAPVHNLGLFIIDDEQDDSYYPEQTPKYDVVEVATKRASYYNATVLLGSTLPSIQSLYRAKSGIYKYLQLENQQYNQDNSIRHIVDMTDEIKNGNRTTISKMLYEKIAQSIVEGRQSVVIVNSLGYARTLICSACGKVKKCSKCDVPLKYYKAKDILKCSICGETEEFVDECDDCGAAIIPSNFAIEAVYEDIKRLFPQAKTAIMHSQVDSDLKEYSNIYKAFNKGDIDILVGTQVVTKGFNKDNVSVIGIVGIDAMLNVPDYRNNERVFRLIAKATEDVNDADVIIQTFLPSNTVILDAYNNDRESFLAEESDVRKKLDYPPYGIFVKVRIVASDSDYATKMLRQWKTFIKSNFVDVQDIGVYALNINSKQSGSREFNFKYNYVFKLKEEYKHRFISLASNYKDSVREQYSEGISFVEINPRDMWRK
ncbi:MAG: primosomal protein N' [Eubacteriales bacterium]|nr:primosomal protein N' [Eubacteriales bacterium]MDY3332791.1 primosomal protein N' [Gallibacter sp.]